MISSRIMQYYCNYIIIKLSVVYYLLWPYIITCLKFRWYMGVKKILPAHWGGRGAVNRSHPTRLHIISCTDSMIQLDFDRYALYRSPCREFCQSAAVPGELREVMTYTILRYKIYLSYVECGVEWICDDRRRPTSHQAINMEI